MNLLWALVILNTSVAFPIIQERSESIMSRCSKEKPTFYIKEHLLVLSNNRLFPDYKSGTFLNIPDVTWWDSLLNINFPYTNARREKEISNIGHPDHSKRPDRKAGNRWLPTEIRLHSYTGGATCCIRLAESILLYNRAQRYKVISDMEHNYQFQRPKQNTGYRLLPTDSRANTVNLSRKNQTQVTSSRIILIWQNVSFGEWLNTIHLQNSSIKIFSTWTNGTLDKWLTITYLMDTIPNGLFIVHFISGFLFSFWTNSWFDQRLKTDHMQPADVLFISEMHNGSFKISDNQYPMENISDQQYYMEDIFDKRHSMVSISAQQYYMEDIFDKRHSMVSISAQQYYMEDISDKRHSMVNISDQRYAMAGIRVKTLECPGWAFNRTTKHSFSSMEHNKIIKKAKMLESLSVLEEEMQRIYFLHNTRPTYSYIVLLMNKYQRDSHLISHKPTLNTDAFLSRMSILLVYCIIFCLNCICLSKSSFTLTFYFKLTANKTLYRFLFQASNNILNSRFYISVYFPNVSNHVQKIRNDLLKKLYPIVSPMIRKTIVRRYKRYQRDMKRTKVKQFFEYYVRWLKAFDLKQKYGRSANIRNTCIKNRRRKNALRGGRKRKLSFRKSGSFNHGKRLYKRKSGQRTSNLRRAFKVFINSSQNSLNNVIQSTQSVVTKTGKIARETANNVRDLFRLRWFPRQTPITVLPFTGSSIENEFLRVATYANFPTGTPVSTLRLARAGFFYTGRSDVVECFHCHVQHGNWQTNDIPSEIHERISPSCNFILGNETENISIDRPSIQTDPSITPLSGPSLGQSRNGDTNVEGTITSGEFQTNSSAYATTGSEHTSAYLSTGSESCEELYSDSIGYSNQCTETSLSTTEQEECGNVHQLSTTSYQTGPGSIETHQHSVHRNTNGISSAVANSKIRNKQTPSDYTKTEKLSNSQTRNVATVQLKPLRQCHDRPKYIAYAVITVRMSSFKGWSSYTGQTPRELAAAGLFYSGCGDQVRCWFCGVGLQSWETNDDPWIEHAKWAPTCLFLRQSKGDEFIQLVHERNNLCSHSNSASNTDETSMPCIQNTHEEIQTPLHLAASVERVKAMGYSTGAIQKAIETLQRDNTPVDTNSIVNELTENEENYFSTNPDRVKVNELTWNTVARTAEVGSCSNGLTERMRNLEIQETSRLMEENNRLRQERKCKICMDVDAVITFVPCGHMICCEECGFVVSKCPVCRLAIETRVKTWMA